MPAVQLFAIDNLPRLKRIILLSPPQAQENAPRRPASARRRGASMEQMTAKIRAVGLDSFLKSAYLPHEEHVGAGAAAHVEQLVAQQEVWQQRRWRWQQAEETLGNEAARAAKANTAILTSFMTNPPLTIGTTKPSPRHGRVLADPAFSQWEREAKDQNTAACGS